MSFLDVFKFNRKLNYEVAKEKIIFSMLFYGPYIVLLELFFENDVDRFVKCIIVTIIYGVLFGMLAQKTRDIVIPLLCGIIYFVGIAGTFYMYAVTQQPGKIECQYEFIFAESLTVFFVALFYCIGNKYYICTLLEWLVVVLAVSYIAYYICYGVPVNADTFFILLQTNALEAETFIENSVFKTISFCVFVVAILYFMKKYNSLIDISFHFSKTALLVLCAILIVDILLVFRDAHLYVHRDYNIANGYFNQVKNMKEYSGGMNNLIANNGVDNIVLVIGESANRDYMGVYGYERNNTPWMNNMVKGYNTILFDKAYTSYRLTNKALAYLLTEKNQYDNKDLYSAINLIDVLKAAGYTTYWYSTQGNVSNYREVYNVIAQKADYMKFDNEAMDDKLLEYLNINENDKKRFIVIHISCSHYPYRHYPAEWNIYGNDNVSDNYDNTIRYTDYILEEIFEKLGRYNPDLFIYISDHGESKEMQRNRFDYRMSHVPFMIYFSNDCIGKIPEKYQIALSREHTYFTHDMFYDTLLDIIGIDSSMYDEDKALFSEKYAFNKYNLKTEYGTRDIADDPYDN